MSIAGGIAYDYENYVSDHAANQGNFSYVVKDTIRAFKNDFRLIKPKKFGFTSDSRITEIEMVDIKMTARQSVNVSIKNNKSIADSMVEDYLWGTPLERGMHMMYIWLYDNAYDVYMTSWHKSYKSGSAVEQFMSDLGCLEDRGQQFWILNVFLAHKLNGFEQISVFLFEIVKPLSQDWLRKHQFRSFVWYFLHLFILFLKGWHVQHIDILPYPAQNSVRVQIQVLILKHFELCEGVLYLLRHVLEVVFLPRQHLLSVL